MTTEASTLYDLLSELGIPPQTVAIELNGQIIRRDSWQSVQLSPSDRVEIIKFVGGG